MVVTFDLFGTLVAVDRPEEPGAAVATALSAQGVSVPGDWPLAYGESHVDAPAGAEVSMSEHVRAALASRGVEPDDENAIDGSVFAAFDPEVQTRPGAREAVAAASERGPVGVLSNCSVRGLVPEALERSALDEGLFDAVVTSVNCGWRKPDPRAFEAAADALGVPVGELRHVGDDPGADGGADDAGATAILLPDVSLDEVAVGLREGRWAR